MKLSADKILKLLNGSLEEQGFNIFQNKNTMYLLHPWLHLRYIDPVSGDPINYSNCYLFFVQDNNDTIKGIGARILPYQQDSCSILFIFNHAPYIIEKIKKNFPTDDDAKAILSYCFTQIEEPDFVTIRKNTPDKELIRINL